MTAPRVSVLLPVRNGAPYFTEALDSILAQEGANFEVIVVDDGSSDGTSELLAGCGDSRLKVIRREGEGLVAALNTALAHARGEYLARMDADDVALPSRLARQIAALDANPAALLTHSSADLIDENGLVFGRIAAEPLSPSERRAVLLGQREGRPIIHPSVMIRRAVLENAGGYRHSPSCEDHELWLRLTEVGPFLAMPEVLLRYRQHGGGISRTRMVEQGISNLTNCVCARIRADSGIDLYADRPPAYAALRDGIAARAAPALESVSLARTVRSAMRKRKVWDALASGLRLAARGDGLLVFNRFARARLVALQNEALAAWGDAGS